MSSTYPMAAHNASTAGSAPRAGPTLTEEQKNYSEKKYYSTGELWDDDDKYWKCATRGMGLDGQFKVPLESKSTKGIKQIVATAAQAEKRRKAAAAAAAAIVPVATAPVSTAPVATAPVATSPTPNHDAALSLLESVPPPVPPPAPITAARIGTHLLRPLASVPRIPLASALALVAATAPTVGLDAAELNALFYVRFVHAALSSVMARTSAAPAIMRSVPMGSVGKRSAGKQAKRKATASVAEDEAASDSHMLSDDEAQAQQARKSARVKCPECRTPVSTRNLTCMPYHVPIDALECPICYGGIDRRSPVVAKCGHFFCAACWQRIGE